MGCSLVPRVPLTVWGPAWLCCRPGVMKPPLWVSLPPACSLSAEPGVWCSRAATQRCLLLSSEDSCVVEKTTATMRAIPGTFTVVREGRQGAVLRLCWCACVCDACVLAAHTCV